jgi:NAD(P)-dependent dehydrogenase (short-subunit alcohol dehydrogenase family)
VWALEWVRRGVTVNAIPPTVVLTDLGRKARDGPQGDVMRALIPTGRFALPEEIAALAAFLASDNADMINGADVLVDGGFTTRRLRRRSAAGRSLGSPDPVAVPSVPAAGIFVRDLRQD